MLYTSLEGAKEKKPLEIDLEYVQGLIANAITLPLPYTSLHVL